MANRNDTAVVLREEQLRALIYKVRGVEVMLDSDLARLYGIETRVFNQAVKRNLERFPASFRFQLAKAEHDSLRSQIVTLNTAENMVIPADEGTCVAVSTKSTRDPLTVEIANSAGGRGRHRKYLPYVFTEQGVAMLSAVLRSRTAIEISISIINAFVAMRRFLVAHEPLLQRLDTLEKRQLGHEMKTDARFEQVFAALDAKRQQPEQGVFFDGQVFDAYRFVSDLLRQAQKSIVLIDNYVDDSVLALLAKRQAGVSAIVLTRSISKTLALDLEKHNAQYPPVAIREFADSHDRFLILDGDVVYHLGASLKDLGKKWFAFAKMDAGALSVMERVAAILKKCHA